MIPEEVIKSIILQMPAIGILLVAVTVLYRDNKADRTQASIERYEQLKQLIILNQYIRIIADKLKVPLPSDASIIEKNDM